MGKKKAGKEDDDGDGEKLTRIAIVSAEKCKPKKVSRRGEGRRIQTHHLLRWGTTVDLFGLCDPYFYTIIV